MHTRTEISYYICTHLQTQIHSHLGAPPAGCCRGGPQWTVIYSVSLQDANPRCAKVTIAKYTGINSLGFSSKHHGHTAR